MKRAAAILILMGSCLFATHVAAQAPLEEAKPVVILNPGHDDFVIPPFFIEGRAEPGEKLGLFVNGYPHQVIVADARGRFLERVAWTHGGTVWVEIRRGDERRHAVQVRVARVTPGVSNRVLAHAAPTLLNAEQSEPPKLLPVRTDSSVHTSPPGFLHQFAVPIREAPAASRHMVTIATGVSLQLLALSAMSLLEYSAQKGDQARSLVFMSMGTQAMVTYVVHKALGGKPNPWGLALGAALPTLVSILGIAADSSALTIAGIVTQPIGATFGATF